MSRDVLGFNVVTIFHNGSPFVLEKWSLLIPLHSREFI